MTRNATSLKPADPPSLVPPPIRVNGRDLWSLQADVRWAHYLGQGVGASAAMRRELSEDSEAASFRVVQTLNIQLGVYTNEIPVS